MTDMTESTELLAFKRRDDGYKVTVISWDELKIPQNLLSVKDKDSPPKVGKSFFSSKERERGGGVNLKMKVILHSILLCFIMSYLLVLRF